MATSKTQIKGLRIINECAEYFDGKPLNRMVESLMDYMIRGDVTYDEDGLHFGPKYMGMEEYADLENMTVLCGGTMEDFVRETARMMNDGSLLMDGERMMLPEWAERLKAECERLGVDPEQFVGKIVEMMGML